MKDQQNKKQTMTITQARTQIFDLADAAYHQGVETTLTKNGKEIARIVPLEEKKTDWGKRLDELKKLMPILTEEDVNQIEQVRNNSRVKRFPEW